MSNQAERGIMELLPPRRGAVGARTKISRGVVSETVQILDIVAVILAGAGSYAFYVMAILAAEGRADYFAFAVIFASLVFVFGMRRFGAYSFRHLSRLGWQLSRVVLAWGAPLRY